jgi:hypothetical protein
MTTAVMLSWALVGGVRRSAQEFVGIAPADRPRAVCPCCGDAVLWKCGEIKAPHVAHAPGSACAATNPETAAHLNAKARIAATVKQIVPIVAPCGKCSAQVRTAWNISYVDRAEVEYRVGSRRPDVVLFGGADDSEIGAVEVYHSHRVDHAKAMDLEACGMRWIEVRAAVANEWDGVAPLVVDNCDAATREEITENCTLCAARERARMERAAEEAERREWDRAARERFDAERVRILEADRAKSAWRATMCGPKWQAFRDARRQRERDVARLLNSPPSLHLVVSASVRGARGSAVVTASLVAGFPAVRARFIEGDWTYSNAIWHALEFAVARLADVCPGRSATIHTSASEVPVQTHSLRWLPFRGDPVEELKARVCDSLARGGHIVLPAAANADATIAYAIARAQAEARRLSRSGHAGAAPLTDQETA